MAWSSEKWFQLEGFAGGKSLLKHCEKWYRSAPNIIIECSKKWYQSIPESYSRLSENTVKRDGLKLWKVISARGVLRSEIFVKTTRKVTPGCPKYDHRASEKSVIKLSQKVTQDCLENLAQSNPRSCPKVFRKGSSKCAKRGPQSVQKEVPKVFKKGPKKGSQNVQKSAPLDVQKSRRCNIEFSSTS